MTDQEQPPADALINTTDGLAYWESISPDVNGMLGGFPHITKVDIQGSRNFLAKLGIGAKAKGKKITVERALEGGAGIGRVTNGLLLDGIAKQVDVIEPIEKFTNELKGKPGVGKVWNMGLEQWDPEKEVQEGGKYDLIWIQWCVGHLTDGELVRFLERCKTVLDVEKGGVIVVKENNSTRGKDDFDELDSSVTRKDATFRRIFKEAKLKLVQVELQKGFQSSGLLPVRMYALKPE
ncbi:alpha-N-methyltransferase NTM1 [Apiosordaria backusii]|uniref:Alpha N-terminal protein methyltransferase 1 n=1 Tax=Apiosordaria backusii TaxID=314023 RepID=A0AA40EI56_9PEZI|nr:alpha-N-methyltransferase NTM1 [Apiosordaria backusii]